MDRIWDAVNFNDEGLVPAIIQDVYSKEVLMLAYMNRQALEMTLNTGKTWFYSRSRDKLWNKGETSGNFQSVMELHYDCDGDALLVKVIQKGNACHTGARSCFFNEVCRDSVQPKQDILQLLYQRIHDRKLSPQEGSYTSYLLAQGRDKILKKLGEETSEVIIGAKNNSTLEVICETADLTYHVLVLLVEMGIQPQAIWDELSKRYN